MADVTQLRYAQLLKRAFGLKAIDPGRVLAPVVGPTFDVADQYRPEDRLGRGERLWAIAEELLVSTVNVGNIILFNPTGSGRLVVLKHVMMSGLHPGTAVQAASSLSAVVQCPTTTLTGGGSYINPKDGRLAGPAGRLTPSTIFLTYSITAAPNQVRSVASDGAVRFQAIDIPSAGAQPFTPIDWDNIDVVIPPGCQVWVGLRATPLPTANWPMYVLVDGYERAVDPSELLPPPS